MEIETSKVRLVMCKECRILKGSYNFGGDQMYCPICKKEVDIVLIDKQNLR